MTVRSFRMITAAGLALGLALSCDSGPIRLARLIRGTVVDCASTSARVSERTGYWSERLEEPTISPNVRENWRAESLQLTSQYPGLLIRIRVEEFASVDVDRTAGQAKGIYVNAWEEVAPREEWFFTTELGTQCGAVSFPRHVALVAMAMPEGGLPPAHIAPFLGVEQISRAPKIFLHYWQSEQ